MFDLLVFYFGFLYLYSQGSLVNSFFLLFPYVRFEVLFLIIGSLLFSMEGNLLSQKRKGIISNV